MCSETVLWGFLSSSLLLVVIVVVAVVVVVVVVVETVVVVVVAIVLAVYLVGMIVVVHGSPHMFVVGCLGVRDFGIREDKVIAALVDGVVEANY